MTLSENSNDTDIMEIINKINGRNIGEEVHNDEKNEKNEKVEDVVNDVKEKVDGDVDVDVDVDVKVNDDIVNDVNIVNDEQQTLNGGSFTDKFDGIKKNKSDTINNEYYEKYVKYKLKYNNVKQKLFKI